MEKLKNFLFIMADQLRYDYLGCTGHPTIRTPHIDALAERSVLFSRTYCQSPICGPSRMSFYTGRYAFSHGSSYNGVPLKISEMTLGDYLRPLGYRVGLVGKTHMRANTFAMQRLGIDPESEIGVLLSECGFEPYERDDGLHPGLSTDYDLPYNTWLRAHGYDGDNPWHSWANSAAGPDGDVLSGWEMRYAGLPARVAEEHSETAYMTDRAIAFIDEAGDRPWCLHLSYIKPHWPYMAPAPYHAMYGAGDAPPVNRDETEKADPHPVYRAFMHHRESEAFARDEVRATVIPTYMGLITQIDDYLGRLLSFLEMRGLAERTVVVVTSDHGDYLGDHWLGEKQFLHEPSVRIPLIVHDPDPAADATRGCREERFTESIDLVPTFIDLAGGDDRPHRLQGRSLRPLLEGHADVTWRDAAFAEVDYAWRQARQELGLEPHEARGYMVRTERWKYVYFEKFPPQLFDLVADPNERQDLGRDPGHVAVRDELNKRLFDWFRNQFNRITVRNSQVEAATNNELKKGIRYGIW